MNSNYCFSGHLWKIKKDIEKSSNGIYQNTIVEPDINIICDRSKLSEKGCTRAPDWIIEIIFPGNPGHDYIYKLNLYADAGVREY